MEKQSKINEVHKVISKKDYSNLYDILCEKLGRDCPFSKFSIGQGFYVWKDTRRKWEEMASASDTKQRVIREAFQQTKQDVIQRLGNSWAKIGESLFTIPDESYIYYYEDEKGNMAILITGWGFKKPVRVIPAPDPNQIKKKSPRSISFIYDNERLSQYDFGIKLAKQVKIIKTNADGLFIFPDLKDGEQYTLVDLTTQKEYRLNVEEGVSHYDFDVTRTCTLKLKARQGDKPIADELINVVYRGNSFSVRTDVSGTGELQLPFYENEFVSASFRDKTIKEKITIEGTEISFLFKDIFSTEIKVFVRENGTEIEGCEINIEYADNYVGKTDVNGIFVQQVEFVEGAICTASAKGYEAQRKSLNKECVNIFEFEKNSVPTPPPLPTIFAPHILIEGDDGYIGKNYPISVDYEGTTVEYISDDKGVVQLSEMEEGKVLHVRDNLNVDNTSEYVLDSTRLEYVFHVPYKPTIARNDIKVMFRDQAGNPMKCKQVRFKQEDKELLSELDDEGNTSFGKDYFENGKTIEVTVVDSAVHYEKIPFTLEDNENEYLIQEKNTSSSGWNMLKQILTVVMALAVLTTIWIFFEGFCSEMFKIIYH